MRLEEGLVSRPLLASYRVRANLDEHPIGLSPAGLYKVSLWSLYCPLSIRDLLNANSLAKNEQYASPYRKMMEYGKYEVSEPASRWMNHILQYDSKRDCAIGNFISL